MFTGSVPGLNGGPSGTGYTATSGRTAWPASPAARRGGADEQWLNPAAFTMNGFELGTIGDGGRGICDGPGFFQVDLRSTRTSALGKRVKLQLRAEMFNVFNRTNFLVGDEVSRTWNPENVVFDTGDPHDRDADHQRHAVPRASGSSPTPPTPGRRSSGSGSASRRFAEGKRAVSSQGSRPFSSCRN